MFRLAPASLAVLAIFNVAFSLASPVAVSSTNASTPPLTQGDFKVVYTVKPINFAGKVISEPKMDYGGSGCGNGNKKCTCTLSSAGELIMTGAGSDGTATGLEFSCLFHVGDVACSIYLDMPYSRSNHLTCGCAGYTFYGCEIPDGGHDFTKEIVLLPNVASSLASPVAVSSTPPLTQGNFKVAYTVKPINFAGKVISEPKMDYGGSGCGNGNKKCTCTLSSAGELIMTGAGSDGTATGLEFSCLFHVSDSACFIHVDIPYSGTNHLTCGCAGYTFYGCEINNAGHDFTKTIALIRINQLQLDEPRCARKLRREPGKL